MKIETSFSPNIKKLLDSSSDLLAEIRGEAVAITHPLNWTYKCLMVLTPPDLNWTARAWIHWYDELYNTTPEQVAPDVIVIVHGHEQGKVCTAQTLCHVYGYQPVGNEASSFLKRWKEKWNYG